VCIDLFSQKQEEQVGLDFITAKAKGFRKLWDGGRTALATPDLLSPEEQWEEQHVLFDVQDGVTLTEGEQLVVQISGATLVALRGHDVLATAANPPESITTAIRRAKGYVLARVARFSAVSRTADLAFPFHQ
jgi:hypothetical protein